MPINYDELTKDQEFDDAPRVLLHTGPLPPFRKGPPLPVIENPNPSWRVCPECGVGPNTPAGTNPVAGQMRGVHQRDCSRGLR